MSCPHATTTTLLWLYGEGDESHAEHVAGCAECQAVIAEHTDVMAAMDGIAPHELDVTSATEAAPRPANRGRWFGATAALLVAALALVVLRTAPSEVASEDAVDLSVFAALDEDPLDEQFDDLALELGDLAANVDAETL